MSSGQVTPIGFARADGGNDLGTAGQEIAVSSDDRVPARGTEAIPSTVVACNLEFVRVLLLRVVLDGCLSRQHGDVDSCDEAAGRIEHLVLRNHVGDAV